MDTSDIESRAGSSYMLVVSDSTDEETRDSLNTFVEQHATVDITKNETPDEAREIVESGLRGEYVSEKDPLVVVHRFDEMDFDFQKFLAQYLKGVAEKNVDLPILVFDSEGENLIKANSDLSHRLYEL